MKKNHHEKKKKKKMNVANENATRYSKKKSNKLTWFQYGWWLIRFIFGVWKTKNLFVRYSIQ